MAAAKNEFIEVVSSSAYQDLEKLINLIDVAGKKIGDINTTMKVVKLPSELNHSVIDMSKSTGELRNGVIKLNQEITKKNQLSPQEIVNNRILTQNANTYAKSVSTLAGAYQNLIAKQQIAARQVQDIVARGRLATQTQKQYNKELDDAQKRFTVLNQKVVQANRAVNKFNDNVGNYPTKAVSGLKDLMGAFGIIGGVTAFASIAKNIFNTTRELQSLDLALRQVVDSEEEFAQTQKFLSDVANRFGIEIKQLTRNYTQFFVVAKDKLSTQQIQDIFESISKAAGVMGLTVEQQQGAFTALTQMLSKGTVQAEELRGQLAERIPGASKIMAQALGVTEQELGKMIEKGEVLASEVLPKFAEQLEKTYNIENINEANTLTAATQNLQNAWTDFVRELSEGDSVVTKALIWTIKEAGETIMWYRNLLRSSKEYTFDEKVVNAYNNALERFQAQAYLSANALKEIASVELGDLTDKLMDLEDARDSLVNEMSGEFGILDKLSGKYSRIKKDLAENENAQANVTGTIKLLNQIIAGSIDLKDKENKVTKTGTQLTEEQRKARQRLIDQERVDAYTLKKLRLETEKKVTEDMLEADNQYASDKLKLSEELTQREIDLAELEKKEGLKQAGDNATKQLIVWEQYFQKRIDIANRGKDRVNKIDKEAADEFADYHEKFEGEGLNISAESLGLTADAFKKYQDELDKTDEKTKKLQQSTEDFLRQFTEGFFQDAGLPTLFKVMNKEIEGFGENWAVTFNALSEIAQEAIAFVNQNQQAYFDAQYARLDKEKEIALKFAGESSEAQRNIEEEYEARKREIRIKEAKSAKDTAIFNATMNIAQGITAALAQGPSGIPLAVVIGALGAIQVSMIASRPLPEYRYGTDNHPGGPMVINDAPGSNYREMAIFPDGSIHMPQERRALINAPSGTRVLTADNTQKEINSMLAANGIGYPTQLLSQLPPIHIESNNGISMEQMEGVMKRSLEKVSVNTVTIDNRGIRTYIHTEMGIKESLNNFTHRKGLSI